ncbi:unnamed protein product [Rhizophagus irregularis]|nr:unnamed protein product [Rhizophagus irregularis]CAB5390165.1 unnamed protein product [Rhizophagus irregularis]
MNNYKKPEQNAAFANLQSPQLKRKCVSRVLMVATGLMLASKEENSYQGLAHPIGSAMHELLHACGSCMKLKSEVKRDFEIGQREMLSEGDIKAINMLYLDSTPDIQRVKITASNEEMKLQFLLKIKSKIFRRKRSQ